MNLEEVLEEYGLSERQAKVYLAALELGESDVSDLAQKAQIRRAGTYYLSESLVKDDLFYRTKKVNKLYYSAVEPKNLLAQAKRKKQIIEENFSELQALSRLSVKKPSIHIYEGIEGIKTAYKRTLAKKNAKMYAFSPYATAQKQAMFHGKEYLNWGLDYIRQRAKKNIFVYDIAEDSPEARERKMRDQEELRETRLVPKEKFPFTNEIDIFQNLVIIISYKELLAILIESEDIAFTLKTIFNLSWEAAAYYKT
jgi:sugar-specific transcriptional regulator TrmB